MTKSDRARLSSVERMVDGLKDDLYDLTSQTPRAHLYEVIREIQQVVADIKGEPVGVLFQHFPPETGDRK